VFHFALRAGSKADFTRWMHTYREAIGVKAAFNGSDMFLCYISELLLKQEDGAPQENRADIRGSFERMLRDFSA
jgi:hypothetical protein